MVYSWVFKCFYSTSYFDFVVVYFLQDIICTCKLTTYGQTILGIYTVYQGISDNWDSVYALLNPNADTQEMTTFYDLIRLTPGLTATVPLFSSQQNYAVIDHLRF